MSSFTGNWKNQYGSLLSLSSDGEFLYGTYASSTGASGVYYVVGFGSAESATQSQGVGIALSILWRSFQGGTPDPSWHWVSGFGGQLIVQNNNVPTIILNHDLVATDNDPGVGDVGSYIDKLTYIPIAEKQQKIEKKFEKDLKAAVIPDPANGMWTCVNPEIDMALALEVVDGESGFMTGMMTLNGQGYPIVGFADNNATEGALSLEGITLTVSLGNGMYAALSGWIDIHTSELALLQQISRGTSAELQFMQTSAQTLYMKKL